jgi:hypothetical protein
LDSFKGVYRHFSETSSFRFLFENINASDSASGVNGQLKDYPALQSGSQGNGRILFPQIIGDCPEILIGKSGSFRDLIHPQVLPCLD